ncbi:MAG: hypothetical protein ACRETW_15315, partial [Stenotrophobium sp.]
MTLAQRTVLIFASVMVCTVLVGLYVNYAFDQLAARAIDDVRVANALGAATQLDSAMLRTVEALDQYVDTRDPVRLKELLDSRAMANHQSQILRSLTRLPRIVELLDQYGAVQPQRAKVTDRIIAAVQAGASTDEIIRLKQERAVIDNKARVYAQEMT